VIIIGPELLIREIDMLCFGFRKVPHRPRTPIKWDGIAEVVSALSIPVIANGDVFEYSDFSVHQRCNW
jgi:tRNA-dihydrouridine synthase